MRAITLHQPWASLIAIGAKPYETRTKPPPRGLIGQRIAVHAAKREAGLLWMDAETGAWWDDLRDRGILPRPLPYGAVVCTAVIAGDYQCGEHIRRGGRVLFEVTARAPGSPASDSYLPVDNLGRYSPGRWAWHLVDIEVLPEPVPARGQQGWWNWEAA